MELKQLKELLETPEVKEALETELNEALAVKQAELDSEVAKLNEEKLKMKKQLFLTKKTLTAKANLYENKLKQYYEAKFEAATKKMADSVYDFINESVSSLVKTIQEDVEANSKVKKLEEAVSQVLRTLTPHANMVEIAASAKEPNDMLKKQLNNALRENKILKSRTLSEDLDALVVAECAGYPLPQVVLIRETLKKMDPQPSTLVEAKSLLSKIKETVRNKAAKAVPQKPVVEARTSIKLAAKAADARVALRKIVEEQKTVQVTENTREMANPLAYDIADV